MDNSVSKTSLLKAAKKNLNKEGPMLGTHQVADDRTMLYTIKLDLGKMQNPQPQQWKPMRRSNSV